jgi:hypothetical protein
MPGFGFTGSLKDRVDELEITVGDADRCGFQRGPSLCSRVDTLERFMYTMKDWKKRVEGKLGVEDITNGRGEKEFLNTNVTTIRGYVKEMED